MDNESKDSLNILDIVAFLLEWRRVWIPATLTCAIALGIYAFTAREKYRSLVIVKGVEAQSSGIGSLIASKLSGLGNIAGFSPSLGEVRGDYYLLILRGRNLSEKVINEFKLREVWKMPDAPIENVIERLAGTTYFKYIPATNTVNIQVDDNDPVRAKQICEFYFSELDLRNQQYESLRARKEREFSGNRLSEARATLYALEDSMAAFQRESGIFNLEEQAKATVHAVASLQAERFLARAEYELKAKLFETGNPELTMAWLRLAGIDSSLSSLSQEPRSEERDFMLNFDRATEDGKTYLRLYRDIEINSLLMAVLTQQYEQARLAEARNTPTLSVVEPAAVSTKRVWPKRAQIIGLGAALGFVLSLLVAGFVNFKRKLSSPGHPSHASYERLVKSIGR